MKNLFFYFENDSLILWDVNSHTQWEIDHSTADYLITHLLSDDQEKISEAKAFIKANGGSSEKRPIHSEWGWDILSYLFHIGTSNIPTEINTADASEWSKDYQNFSKTRFAKVSGLHDYPEPDIKFNAYSNQEAIYQLLSERETHREFSNKPISFESLEKMLVAVFAFRETESFTKFIEKNTIETYLYKRSAPSAGGLQCVDIYLNIKNVTGVNPGVYLFNPKSIGLIYKSSVIPDSKLIEILNGQPFSKNSSFDIIYAARFDRLWNKYEHSRGYRAALLDVGHLSENMLLCSKHEGLESFVTGSFSDSQLSEKIRISLPCAPIFFSSFGYGNKQFVPMSYFK